MQCPLESESLFLSTDSKILAFSREPSTPARQEMVGIFSRLSAATSGHRRTKSAMDTREILPTTMEVGGPSTGIDHEIDASVEFKPIERPIEPLNHDQPIRCPLPDPSILNDGNLWRGRLSCSGSSTSVRTGLAIEKHDSLAESEAGGGSLPQSATTAHEALGSSVPLLRFTQ